VLVSKFTCLLIREITYCSKNLWSPFIRSVICWPLFRLKKGFFGGSSGSCTLQQQQQQQHKNTLKRTIVQVIFNRKTENIIKLSGQNTVKPTYISWEFACSFCLSQTNSLNLLLTIEIFLVKHKLSVWNRTHVRHTLQLDLYKKANTTFFCPFTYV